MLIYWVLLEKGKKSERLDNLGSETGAPPLSPVSAAKVPYL
jgi:hypothetical protein